VVGDTQNGECQIMSKPDHGQTLKVLNTIAKGLKGKGLVCDGWQLEKLAQREIDRVAEIVAVEAAMDRQPPSQAGVITNAEAFFGRKLRPAEQKICMLALLWCSSHQFNPDDSKHAEWSMKDMAAKKAEVRTWLMPKVKGEVLGKVLPARRNTKSKKKAKVKKVDRPTKAAKKPR